jgi:hypothetical protein
MNKKIYLIIGIFLILCIYSYAFNEVIDQETGTGDDANIAYDTTSLYLAGNWSASKSYDMTNISVLLSSNTYSGAAICNMKIYTWNTTTKKPQSYVASSINRTCQGLTGGAWNNFTFSPAVSFTSGQHYAYVFYTNTAMAGAMGWRCKYPYGTSGMKKSNAGSTWSDAGAEHCDFKTYNGSVAAAPPTGICSCPSPAAQWNIVNGSVCNLTTTCDIRPYKLRVIDGKLRITTGKLLATGCQVMYNQSINVFKGGGLNCR